MSVETSNTPPEGAKAVTAKDVISVPAPEKFEDVQYWLIKSPLGVNETIKIRPELGEKCEFQQSPLDGSFLAMRFTFKAGEKNETRGEQLFPMSGVFFYSVAYVQEAVYKDGESPAEVEFKRREKIRLEQIEKKAAQLDEGLDGDD